MNGPQWASGAHCGHSVTITNPATGLSAKAAVTNECPGCASGDLDMCHSLFGHLTNGHYELGIFQISWSQYRPFPGEKSG